MKKNDKTGTMKKLGMVIVGICLTFTGCQKTPEESAIVSKAEGLSESVIAKPMKEGETRTYDIPSHWTMEELRNKDRFLITADVELKKESLATYQLWKCKTMCSQRKN